MRIRRKVTQYLAGTLISSSYSLSLAAVDHPWFVELGFGLSEIDSPLELGANPPVLLGGTWIPAPITVHPSSGFETDEGLTFTLGHKFADNWGVEVSYLDFGDFGSKSTFSIGTTPYVSQQTQVNIDGLNLALFGEIPITERWTVRGKVGVFAYESDSGVISPTTYIQGLNCNVVTPGEPCYNPFFVTNGTPSSGFIPQRGVNGTYLNPSVLPDSDGGQRISFTVGGRYRLSDRYSFNLDYSLFNDVDETDIEMVKLGLSYSF